MKDGFDRALARVLVYEGGKADDPRDPGGRTNEGVTQRVYDAYRARKGQGPRDVHRMAAAERDAIYRAQYWDVVQGDALPSGIDFLVFDGAVNSGPAQSAKWLQRALADRYTGRVDGIVGTATLNAVDRHPDHDALIAAVCQRRMDFLRALKTWPAFGRGWTIRVEAVRAAGQAWAGGADGPPAASAAQATARAHVETAKPPPTKAVADAATGGGIAVTTLGQAVEQLTPLAGQNATIANVVMILTIAGVALTVAGIAYRAWATHRASRLADALDLPTNVRSRTFA